MIVVALALYYVIVSAVYALLSLLERSVADSLVVLFVALLLVPEALVLWRRRRHG